MGPSQRSTLRRPSPTKPVSPKTPEWTVLPLIIGVILGIGSALLVNALAPRQLEHAEPAGSPPRPGLSVL
jgi:hypothetical protein